MGPVLPDVAEASIPQGNTNLLWISYSLNDVRTNTYGIQKLIDFYGGHLSGCNYCEYKPNHRQRQYCLEVHTFLRNAYFAPLFEDINTIATDLNSPAECPDVR